MKKEIDKMFEKLRKMRKERETRLSPATRKALEKVNKKFEARDKESQKLENSLTPKDKKLRMMITNAVGKWHSLGFSSHFFSNEKEESRYCR